MGSTDTAQIEAYLYPPVGYFWRWEDHGRVAAWSDGETLAYVEELAAVVDHLVPIGLPPMGALLLFMAACRRDWPEKRPGIRGRLRGLIPPATPDWDARMEMVQRVLGLLDAVQRVPSSRRTGVGQRAALARIVFEGSTTPTALGEAVMATLVASRPSASKWTPGNGLEQLGMDLACLNVALVDFSAERAVWRLQTGMDGPPPPVPKPRAAKEESLGEILGRLADDPEFSLLVQFARQLRAATSLPRPLSEADGQALGGISDIANRGRLDRLLLTELANDPLVLATRVALNEALYWRHEMPPKVPSTERLILLDSGIRTWGIARIGILAMGLALQEGDDVTIRSFVLQGHGFEPVNLRTEDGLRQAMAATSPVASPFRAIAELFAGEPKLSGDAEVIVVTAGELAGRSQLQAALGQVGLARRLVAGVESDGRVAMAALGEFGRKRLFECRLPLPEKPKLRVRRLGSAVGGDESLPGIFGRRPFPLRLPSAKAPQRATWDAEIGVVGVTADRRVLLWEGSDKGAVQLAEQISERSVLAMAMRDGWALLLRREAPGEALTLERYSLDGMSQESVVLPASGETTRWAAFAPIGDDDGFGVAVATAAKVQAFDLKGGLVKSYPSETGVCDRDGLAWAQELEAIGSSARQQVPHLEMARFLRARRSVMLGVEQVAISEDGGICVMGRGTSWTLLYEHDDDQMRFVRSSTLPPRQDRLDLRPLSGDSLRGYRVLVGLRGKLGVAVDQRGLLHLYEVNGGSRQVSIVLTQGATAGLNQSCDYCGPDFFRFFGQTAATREIWQEILVLAGKARS